MNSIDASQTNTNSSINVINHEPIDIASMSDAALDALVEFALCFLFFVCFLFCYFHISVANSVNVQSPNYLLCVCVCVCVCVPKID
jgi:hypothetical protein